MDRAASSEKSYDDGRRTAGDNFFGACRNTVVVASLSLF